MIAMEICIENTKKYKVIKVIFFVCLILVLLYGQDIFFA